MKRFGHFWMYYSWETQNIPRKVFLFFPGIFTEIFLMKKAIFIKNNQRKFIQKN
jgi:hypothetical protein